MRHVTLATIAVAIVAVVACQQDSTHSSVTGPDAAVRSVKSTGGSCDAATARTISAQQADLYVKPALDSARAYFAPVVTSCASDSTAARNSMLKYIQWTIDNFKAIQAPTSPLTEAGALLVHWNTVFPYVGYVGANQPSGVPETIFGSTGAAGVITQATDAAHREIRTSIAALKLPVQDADGDARAHLFVVYPLTNGCLTGSNLRQYGPCYEFGSYPKVKPSFSPKIFVGICQPEGPDHQLGTGALGHLSSGFVEIPNQQTYPQDCTNAYADNDRGSWTGGFGEIAKRLASIVHESIGVQTAYAVHGGLGGLGGGLSPFGGVDREVFKATFTNDTIGKKPGKPEVGTWAIDTVTPPGSITVQGSLGESATGNLVVLNQAGGACTNCGGLLLQGNLFLASGGSAPDSGIYETKFIALQDGPTMKAASFKLRDTQNRVLAQLTYDVKSNVNRIFFNGTNTGINWVRHKPNSFRIVVNLTSNTASLEIDGTAVLTGLPFFNIHATNFANIAADFGGIDSGIMGWDQITVDRLEDSN